MPTRGVIGCRTKREEIEPLVLVVRGKPVEWVSIRKECLESDLAVMGRIM